MHIRVLVDTIIRGILGLLNVLRSLISVFSQTVSILRYMVVIYVFLSEEAMYSYCYLCILIVVYVLLLLVYVFLLLVYVFLLLVYVILSLSMYSYCYLCILRRGYPD